MKNKLFKLSALLLLILTAQQTYAKGIESLFVAVGSETIAFPFTTYSPMHPSVDAGVSLLLKDKEASTRKINAKMGFYSHKRVENAIYIGGEYQHTFKLINRKVGIDAIGGLGYLHSFYSGEIYEQDANGDFESVGQSGRPHAYINAAIGLSYLGWNRVTPFVRQEMIVESPFANSIPVISHSIVKVGVNIKFGR